MALGLDTWERVVQNIFKRPGTMKLAWLTDIHLNFVGRSTVENLCSTIQTSGANAVLITGDIATSEYLPRYLEYLADTLNVTVYFVLGNHDYYGSSIEKVNSQVDRVVKANRHLIWLSRSGVTELAPDTCLIGHEGLADGRLGDPEGSQVILNDYYHIEELNQPTKELRLEVQHKLGDEAAAYLTKQLHEAITVRQYKKIIVALHVPPYPESCWHEGSLSDASFLPHFACMATGKVLKAAMARHPDISITVYCGHTHSAGFTTILPNLDVITGGAEYYNPRITDLIEVGINLS